MADTPAAHADANAPVRYFEDIEIGEVYEIPSRTHTDALFAAFQLASGDNSPMHYDYEYAREHGWPGLLAHGFQVLIQTCPGASNIHRYKGRLNARGMVGMSCEFLKPVYSGDTLTPKLEVVDLKPNRATGVMTLRSTVHNQRGELVLEGSIKMLLNRRPADS